MAASGTQPSDKGGIRVILGLAPAKWDLVTCTYDANDNLLTATFSYAGTNISVVTCTYDANDNLLTAGVGVP